MYINTKKEKNHEYLPSAPNHVLILCLSLGFYFALVFKPFSTQSITLPYNNMHSCTKPCFCLSATNVQPTKTNVSHTRDEPSFSPRATTKPAAATRVCHQPESPCSLFATTKPTAATRVCHQPESPYSTLATTKPTADSRVCHQPTFSSLTATDSTASAPAVTAPSQS